MHDNIDHCILLRAYGLIKYHKEGFCVRIIVSAIDGLHYNFDKGLSKLFNDSIPCPKHSCRNSFELEKEIDKLTIL